MTEPWKYLPNNLVSYSESEGDDRLNLIRERWDSMKTFWGPIHDRAREEDLFIAGEQWADRIRKEREAAGRPVYTFNLLPAFTRQIINKTRQDRPQLRVKPVQSDKRQTPKVANVQGTQDYSLADVYMGIFRNIEHLSSADHAYDTALMHCVWHAFGFFTLNTQECPDDPFNQELVIERVKDSYSVWTDPMAQKADYSDMQDAFTFQRVTRDAFKKLYPGANSGSANVSVEAGLYADWFDRDSLQIGTYWWVEHENDEVVKMEDGRVHFMSDIEDVLDEWADAGHYPARGADGEQMRKKVRRPVARWQRFTAIELLTEETETVFDRIPIFPVLGDEITLNDRIQYMSAIRDAIGAQQSYNFHRTAAIETLALQPKAPFTVAIEQIRGHEKHWEQANRSNKAYLPYNYIEGLTAPQRSQPPQPAFAEFSQAQQDAQDIQAIVGLHDASLGKESNEKSGKAVLARQRQGSTSTYQFPANLGRAIVACGRCAVRAIPKIYDTERVMRIRMPDDKEDFVTINQTTTDEETGKEVLSNDITYGRYDVVIDTGPSYATQREESIEAMLELLSVLPPEALVAVTHLIVENMAFPGAEKVAAILRKMIPDHLKSEDERAADLPKGVVFDEEGNAVKEDGTPYEPPMTPAMQVQQQTNQIEQAKVEAEMAKAQGDQAMAQAKMKESEAKVAKAQADLAKAEVEMAEAQRPPDVEQEGPDINGIAGELREAIVEALEQHRQDPNAHKEAIDNEMAQQLAELVPALRKMVEGLTDKKSKEVLQSLNTTEKKAS